MIPFSSRKTAYRVSALAVAGSLLLANVTMLGGCASKINIKSLSVDKVIKTLEKNFDAEEYDDDLNDPFEFYEFEDGYYITGEGKDDADFMSFCGLYRGIGNIFFNYTEVSHLQKFVNENKCEYVLYSQFERGESIDDGSGVMMAFVEFDDADDATDCFEDIMEETYFNEDDSKSYQIHAYERALDSAEYEKDRYEGTLYGDYLSLNDEDEEVVELDDLDEANYTFDSKSGRFDYNIRWECLKMGDLARANPDDEDIIDNPNFFVEGIMGHHLCVEGNKLLLVYGFDFGTSKGKVESVNGLCKALSTGDPFDVKMNNELKKYLLFVHWKWSPNGARLDKY